MERDADVKDWIGKQQVARDHINGKQSYLMDSLINGTSNGAIWEDGRILPPLWHWSYFPVGTPLEEAGPDGLPETGGFLPPMTLPRRMWAGSRLEFHYPIRIGDEVEKVSTIKSIVNKNGRSGALCFVTLSHESKVGDQVCIYEEQDIVYRDPVPEDAPSPEPSIFGEKPDFQQVIHPNEVMLFIYSALTFNSHRIHYDRDYCQNVEGLEDLLVHGPLTATLLVGFATRHNPGKILKSFNFRAVSPLLVSNQFTLNAKPDGDVTQVWAENHKGELSMRAEAVFS